MKWYLLVGAKVPVKTLKHGGKRWDGIFLDLGKLSSKSPPQLIKMPFLSLWWAIDHVFLRWKMANKNLSPTVSLGGEVRSLQLCWNHVGVERNLCVPVAGRRGSPAGESSNESQRKRAWRLLEKSKKHPNFTSFFDSGLLKIFPLHGKPRHVMHI